ncbi:sodium/hydrogen exchanger 6 [Tanacetum coccineum]
MESSTNLNKGEGLAGKSKADDLRAFMHKSTTETRRAIGELKNPNSSFEGPRVSNGSFPVGNHARDSSFIGRTSQTGVRDTDTNINPNMDSFPEGDHVRVSNFTGRSSSSQNYPHTNVTGSFTSRGESTNFSFSTSFRVTNDAQSPMLNNKDPGVNLGSTSVTQVDNTNDHDTSIVQSVEINTITYHMMELRELLLRTKQLPTFFLGWQIRCLMRMAFPIVEYYVKNNWAKYELKRIMMNAKGFFFFKFDSRAGLDAVLEGGIPDLEGSSHTKETIRVECEWKPPRCPTCNIFRHTSETCPKKVVSTPVVNDTNVTNDGFQKVVNRKCNNKGSSAGNKLPKGVPISKSFQVGKEFTFQPKASNVGSNNNTGTRGVTNPKAGPYKNTNDDAPLITKGTNTRQQDTGKKKISNIASPNPFAALGVDDDEEEEVENIWDESKNLNLRNTEASTPAQMSHVDVAVVYYTCKKVNTCADHKTLFCSFVYADNYYIDRHVLWSNLVGHAGLMRNRPSVLLGDFNTAFNLEDHSAGGYEPNAAMREFKDCVQAMEVGDVNSTGLYFTWNQKPKVSNGILKKIDRIMGNLQFNDAFLGSFAIFQPYRILDHLPCVLEAFREILETGWSVNLEGCAMFHVVKRLKGLKSPFHKLLHNYGNLHERVNKIRIELDEAQKAIDRDPSSFILHEEHAHYLLAFKAAQLDEERFLKQKANIEWLKAGDSNTTYFHKIVKSKCTRNRIEMVSDASNNLYDGNHVPGAFVNHYNQFLGAKGVTILLDDHNQVRDVSNDEVKSFIFSIEDDRAPGPDGFTAAFFKKAWDVVGGDITCVVRDFFSNGKLLKELNHTIISLIPKVTTPTCINDYRPISCCNVLYKCISKIIANGVKEDLTDIVSINQSAFVLGRRISNNIFLTQELIRNYHRRRGPPRCAFKVDIQKAYDTVDWSFLETILVGFGFHPKMVQWIMVCVSRASYSICVNGNLHGFFLGKGIPR